MNSLKYRKWIAPPKQMDTRHVLNVDIDIRLAFIHQNIKVCILNTEWENFKVYKVL